MDYNFDKYEVDSDGKWKLTITERLNELKNHLDLFRSSCWDYMIHIDNDDYALAKISEYDRIKHSYFILGLLNDYDISFYTKRDTLVQIIDDMCVSLFLDDIIKLNDELLLKKVLNDLGFSDIMEAKEHRDWEDEIMERKDQESLSEWFDIWDKESQEEIF